MHVHRIALAVLLAPLCACYHHGELGNVGYELRLADVLYEFESGDRVLIGTTLCPVIAETLAGDVHQHWIDDEQALGCYDESVSGPAQFDADRCWLLDMPGEVLWELTSNGACVADGEALPGDRLRITVAPPDGALRLGFDDWRVRVPIAPGVVGDDPAIMLGQEPGRTLDDLREDPSAPRRVFAGQLDAPMLRLDDDLGRLWFVDADVELEVIGDGATAVEPVEPTDPEEIATETRLPGERPLVLESGAVARIRATLPGGMMLESPELIAVPQSDAADLDLMVMISDDGVPLYAYAEVRDAQDHVLHAAPVEWDVVEGALGVIRGGLDADGRTGEYATLVPSCQQPSTSEPLERHAILRARLGTFEDSVELNWTEPPSDPDHVVVPFEADESCMFGADLDEGSADDRGCACSSDAKAPGSGMAGLALAALVFVRRRRSRPR